MNEIQYFDDNAIELWATRVGLGFAVATTENPYWSQTDRRSRLIDRSRAIMAETLSNVRKTLGEGGFLHEHLDLFERTALQVFEENMPSINTIH